jgi:L-lactate dehydrogenase complex protein LldG
VSARENILRKIRDALGKPQVDIAAEKQLAEKYIQTHPAGPKLKIEQDLVKRFIERASYLSMTIAEVNDIESVPQEIEKYLSENNLDRKAVCWPEFSKLNWQLHNLEVEVRPVNGGDLIGVTGVFCAIAETGTLMCVSGENTPPATSLLPETHIAIVPTNRIVAHMEEGWSLMRSTYRKTPRAVNFISGPSRTGDIEQTIVVGAHGPYRVHIILVHK